jgi:hypothetical protein
MNGDRLFVFLAGVDIVALLALFFVLSAVFVDIWPERNIKLINTRFANSKY